LADIDCPVHTTAPCDIESRKTSVVSENPVASETISACLVETGK
jgi:hypothetical protein